MLSKLPRRVQSWVGIAVSALCAVAVALLFSGSRWKLAVPFLFAPLMVLLAGRFGAAISLAGSLVAAAIFALLLFPPLHSLHVAGDAERGSLAWMILTSVSLSYLLHPTRGGKDS